MRKPGRTRTCDLVIANDVVPSAFVTAFLAAPSCSPPGSRSPRAAFFFGSWRRAYFRETRHFQICSPARHSPGPFLSCRSARLVEVTGVEPATGTKPGHYSWPILGLKCASLVGPLWLFRCNCKDPLERFHSCLEVNPPVSKHTFPGTRAFPGEHPLQLSCLKSVPGGRVRGVRDVLGYSECSPGRAFPPDDFGCAGRLFSGEPAAPRDLLKRDLFDLANPTRST